MSDRDRTAVPDQIIIRMGAYAYHVAAYVKTVLGTPIYRSDSPSFDSEAEAVESLREVELHCEHCARTLTEREVECATEVNDEMWCSTCVAREALASTEDEVAAEMDEPAPSEDEDEDPRNACCPTEIEEEQSRYPDAPQAERDSFSERDAKLAAEAQTAAENSLDPEACPGCGCLPGDGLTDGCEDEDGCGYYRTLADPEACPGASPAGAL